MDTYQPIYDAVRSKIAHADVSEIVRRIVSEAFDTSRLMCVAEDELAVVSREYTRPSVLMRPSLSVDGDMYCALYGDNIIEGCAGFGATPEKAMIDFDKNWETKLARDQRGAGGRQ